MEATFGRKAHQFYSGPVVSDLKAVGKRSMEWDLNDWNWDGDLFRATPLKNPLLSDAHNRHFLPVTNSSSSCSDEVIIVNDKGKRELEKRRRVSEHEEELNGSLNLKLGGQVYPMTEGEMEELEGKSGKKSKVVGATLSRLVCQVDDCRADLSTAKDYHRRHKVCDVHSKATRALVGKEMQRFCQQCSRFHVLQEFDEGKRSCRRRLAGHNRRRRKTHPENAVNGVPVIDERSSSYLLISLLRILSNIHSSNSDETKDQVLLSHLLKNLGSLTSTINDTNLSALLNGHQDLQNAGTSKGTLEKDWRRPNGESVVVPPPTSQSAIVFPSKNMIPAEANASGTTVGRQKMSNFDLNSVYDDSQDCTENLESSETYVGTTLWVHQDSNKSSPPQTSGNSGSLSTLCPSTSSGEAQSRTDRIVFKLFGKDPTDLPLGLRNQIMEWLSHTPTDIESYIRPGCIILTIYLRMEKSVWEELYSDLSCNLRRLMDASTDSFWKTGWIYTRVRNRVAFAYNGQVVLDTPLKSDKSCKILSIKPIAVSISERAEFLVRGVNLSQSTTRLLCALEGKYLFQQSCLDMEGGGSFVEHEKVQSLGFPCSTPNVTGRGFIEVEDYGLSSSFFPFIVAEKDVCSEICTLDRVLEVAETADDLPPEKTEARNQALDFIHEMGWLLHKTHLKLKPGFVNTNSDSFPFKRFKWLIEFSIEHDWCAVVKKLLDISFTCTVDTGEHRSIEVAVQEIGPLHRAMRRSCRPMVDFLLNYYPEKSLDKPGSEKQPFDAGHMLFRPDAIGPGGLTPLHIAASGDGSENLLDALMDDPGLVGIEAWRSARDSAGLTPNDYACMRGHFSYIHIVQKKTNNKKSAVGQVVLDIPTTIVESKIKQKVGDAHKSSAKVATFETEKTVSKPVQRHCNRCEQKLAYGTATTSLKFYRPAMLSMVGIAAVCVCVALLFKSSPEVHFSFKPFRWEGLDYGWS